MNHVHVLLGVLCAAIVTVTATPAGLQFQDVWRLWVPARPGGHEVDVSLTYAGDHGEPIHDALGYTLPATGWGLPELIRVTQTHGLTGSAHARYTADVTTDGRRHTYTFEVNP